MRSVSSGLKPSGFRPDKTRAESFLNGFKNIPQKACVFGVLQKHSTKSVCLWSPNKSSNCERKTLAYKKNKLCHECFIGIAHARDASSVI